MLRRVAEESRAVIVHNPAAARMVLRHAPGARVHVIPHPFLPLPGFPASEVLRLRRSMGIGADECVFVVMGYLRESKRLPVVIRALDEVGGKLLIAGEFVSSDLARAVAPLLKRQDVIHLRRAAERDFWLLAALCDACVNLRYPAAGETSGITIRLMGLGKPVIMTEGEENADFPAGACLRVAHGVTEQDELIEQMTLLASSRGVARDVGRLAAAHIRQHHGLESVADSYWKVLCDCRN
jgi:glycosyltransferase involved in cell wall biosynthesis